MAAPGFSMAVGRLLNGSWRTLQGRSKTKSAMNFLGPGHHYIIQIISNPRESKRRLSSQERNGCEVFKIS
jgi:hypothetical protein